MSKEEYIGYGMKDRKKLKGIKGILIVIASWNITSVLIYLSSFSNISQVKLSCILSNNTSIPDKYFDIASLGYLMAILMSVILVFVFFKKLKIYKYLEIVNLLAKCIFLGVLYYVLGDINPVSTVLTDLLPASIVVSVLIVIYLFTSYRAKNTFINWKNPIFMGFSIILLKSRTSSTINNIFASWFTTVTNINFLTFYSFICPLRIR